MMKICSQIGFMGCLFFGSLQGAPVVLTVAEGGDASTIVATDTGFSVLSNTFGGEVHGDITIDPLTEKALNFQYAESGTLTYSDGTTSYTPLTFPQITNHKL